MGVGACACMGACVYAESKPHVDVAGELREDGRMSRGNWECQALGVETGVRNSKEARMAERGGC